MCLNRFGCVVWREWEKLGALRQDVVLDAFLVMPNHVHLVIWLQNVPEILVEHNSQQLMAGSLGAIVGGFKSAVSREIGTLRGERTKVWQRSYFDRILRDERELLGARRYIENNVAQWPNDKHHP